MKMQFAVALVAVLGLSGCGGGGGGGGGSDEPDRSGNPSNPSDPGTPGAPGPTPNTSVTTLQLAGTWQLATGSYGAADVDGERDWLSTRRQTFVITRVNNSVLRLKDCVADTATADWTLASGILSRSGQTSLTVTDANTMVATSGGGATQIRLERLSQDKQPQLDLYSPLDRNTWNQLCAETFVAPGVTNNVQLRAAGTEGIVSATVKMKFESGSYFTPQVYWYSGGGDVSGSYAVTGIGSGNLNNPDGYMALSEVANVYNFDVSVEMDIQGTSNVVSVMGNFRLHADWLATPDDATAQSQ